MDEFYFFVLQIFVLFFEHFMAKVVDQGKNLS